MKKFALVLALVMLLSAFAGCGGNANETTTPAVAAPEGTTDELLNKLYENVTVELNLMNIPVDLTDADAIAYYTGAESAEGMVEATVSEPMMGSQAYSITLVRCEDAEKAAALAQTMFDNIDTRKWICVEATEKQAVVCGDLALFVMLDPAYGVTTDQIVEGFTTLCGGAVDSVIK